MSLFTSEQIEGALKKMFYKTGGWYFPNLENNGELSMINEHFENFTKKFMDTLGTPAELIIEKLTFNEEVKKDIESEYYTQQECAEILQKNIRSIKRYIEYGWLTTHRVGKSKLILKDDLKAFQYKALDKGIKLEEVSEIEEGYLTIDDCSKVLNKNRRTIERLIQYGLLPSTKSSKRLILEKDLMFLKERMENEDQDIKAKFINLKRRWKKQTEYYSSSIRKYNNEHYKEIINLGMAVIPTILFDITRNGANHWDGALRAISGENPIPKSCYGNIEDICKIWTKWGKDKGIV